MVQKFRAISIEQLTEVSVLRDLQAADIIALQPHTRIHFYQKGDIVMTEGDLFSPQLYTLIQGTLRLTRIGTSGKETLLRTQRHANESGTIRVVQGEQLNLKLFHYQIARSIGISYEECVQLLSQIKAVVSYQRGVSRSARLIYELSHKRNLGIFSIDETLREMQ